MVTQVEAKPRIGVLITVVVSHQLWRTSTPAHFRRAAQRCLIMWVVRGSGVLAPERSVLMR